MIQDNKCPFCGANLQENALFCPYCMQTLQEKDSVVTERKKRKSWLFIILGTSVSLLAFAAVLFWPKEEHTHTWEAVTETVHHEAVGYMDMVIVGYEKVTHHYCCYEPDKYLAIFSMEGMREHMIRNHSDEPDFEQVMSNLESLTKKEEADMPIYDYVPYDVPAYDETVITGYKCNGCGKTKEADDPPK